MIEDEFLYVPTIKPNSNQHLTVFPLGFLLFNSSPSWIFLIKWVFTQLVIVYTHFPKKNLLQNEIVPFPSACLPALSACVSRFSTHRRLPDWFPTLRLSLIISNNLHFHPKRDVFSSKLWLLLDSQDSQSQDSHHYRRRRLKMCLHTTKPRKLLVIPSWWQLSSCFCQNHLWWGHMSRRESLVHPKIVHE